MQRVPVLLQRLRQFQSMVVPFYLVMDKDCGEYQRNGEKGDHDALPSRHIADVSPPFLLRHNVKLRHGTPNSTMEADGSSTLSK